jgi:hypothetical protein
MKTNLFILNLVLAFSVGSTALVAQDELSQSLALENVGDKGLTMVSVSTKGVRGKS